MQCQNEKKKKKQRKDNKPREQDQGCVTKQQVESRTTRFKYNWNEAKLQSVHHARKKILK